MSNKGGLYGPVSFAELEELVEAREEASRIMSLGSAFSMLSDNILMDDEIEDKTTALSSLLSEYSERLSNANKSAGVEATGEPSGFEVLLNIWSAMKGTPMKSEEDEVFPASHYLIVDNPQDPETWYIRVKDKAGNIDPALLNKAWFDGEYRDELKELYSKSGLRTPENMSIVKDKSGKWLWFARYSNKYLDDDYPQEIISEQSHLNFVKEVREGREDYPELWLHHIKGTTWGKATWVGYDSGFALAAGYIYPEYEDIAISLSKQTNILLSHGMSPESIIRDPDNPNIILQHATKEISPLPAHRAANKLTGFIVLEEEDNMSEKGLSREDRETLVNMGIAEASIEKLDNATSKIAEVAENSDLPRKEVSEPDVAQEQTQVEQEAVEEVVEQVEDRNDELLGILVESVKAINDRMVAVQALAQANANSIEAMAQEHNKIVGESTKASRISILQSVIGNEDARVDGRKSLARSGPVESKPNGGGLFWREEGWTNGN